MLSKKGLVSVAVSISMVMGLSLYGCGKTSSDTQSDRAQSKQKAIGGEVQSKKGNKSNAKKKLTIGIQGNSFVTDYEDNYFTHYLEDKLGVDLNFYLMPQDGTEFNTKLSLMVTNGKDMPDVIICDNCLTPETIVDYGSKGAFIPLNDYIKDKDKSPNYHEIPEKDRDIITNSITNADDNIYALPKYEPAVWNLTPYRMFVNKTWLDKLGLKAPSTTDELYTVLKAFHDKDPNGNGQQDELGVYGSIAGGYGEAVPWAIMNSFTFYNGGGQNGGLALNEKGDKVIAPFTTSGWKNGLKYMNKLYNEGLLSSAIFTDDDTQFKATLNAETDVVGFVSAGSTSSWVDANNNKNFQDLDVVSPLKGPDGVAYTPYTAYAPANNYFITSACKNPDLAFKLGDTLLNVEVSKVARFGKKGTDWTDDPKKCASTSNSYVDAGLTDGIKMAITSDFWTQQQNTTWHNVNPKYEPEEFQYTLGNCINAYDPNAKTEKLNAYNYEHYSKAHPKKILPLLHYTLDETSEISQALLDIPEYVKQATAEFVIGQRDIDKDWDAYVSELDNMGLKPWLKCAQKAYGRIGK